MTDLLAGQRGGVASDGPPTLISSVVVGGRWLKSSFRFAGKRLPLFANVWLVRAIEVEGQSLPSGASGTIVEELPGEAAYIVEIFEPYHCIVTIHDDALSVEEA